MLSQCSLFLTPLLRPTGPPAPVAGPDRSSKHERHGPVHRRGSGTFTAKLTDNNGARQMGTPGCWPGGLTRARVEVELEVEGNIYIYIYKL